jgi:hypothetical protein
LKITGGNAEVLENTGVPKIATRKLLYGKELKIDEAREFTAGGSGEPKGNGAASRFPFPYRRRL